ncbi:MAG: hypothetical protein A3G52_04320 [Candidatus Taylorbacteria bacterium RIFCSPLOWO2_12_FULL_43_20]|uniref:HTH deoR-type domain-containing protein n=1 Tax=Candidatus Taylorbacteria bacterium RIFCSPLOWO2_12_FULL_43_20 TaxID=1802332 RepID=A0A1G2P053_9BACT|nr:MAG: hypothetical protein A2825_01455 [Candidatus Taylorbacteria bacterium RIFCSPHIGHO2_01_FULL_43_120]OHA23842.1 MAG: hypothetical protein A3B98_04550 [Candidatus Taylorbacteria bacterium RIFCSPHIGHO2_02_FULL_43_55]OHA30261.1 MAG: hypothetical protein A3E92_04270 [Candidatus Taylorbacteria bacterium RIFCSPHIGHO2_12_FULL_42_34]OHA30474.1 MAG: hypothetical protein A3B09_03445 [Candidatus Taylorbacteria bacterium RIFCSPLOWO2_01_FULL_43_83]OHA38664.1 MAG: hypothetical protein A3H58_03470 [Candi
MDHNKTEQDVKKYDIPNDLGAVNVFKDDGILVFLYKKTEKIITATHLITDSLKDEEPIRRDLRQKSCAALSNILAYNSRRNYDSARSVAGLLLELVSLYEIGENSGLISHMNCSVMKAQIAIVMEEFNRRLLNYSIPLREDIFDVGTTGRRLSVFMDANKEEVPEGKGHSKGHEMSFRNKTHKGHNEQDMTLKDRKEKIVSIVRKMSVAGIKDISGQIKGCSEKTIQRDLIALVNEGVLKKIGEKRWSRYQYMRG